MADTYDLILKGGTVVNHDGEGVRDLGIRGGRFQAIGDLSRASAGEVIDCRGLHLLPGVIDTQVHFREPGLTHKEDLESGSLSAVMGGVTAVFEMPNTDPLTVSAEALADKVKRGHHRMHCDFAFFVGATPDNTRHLAELERLPGCAGVKVFMGSSTGSLLVADDAGLRAVLKIIRRRASFHAEDEPRLNERKNLRVEGDARSHPVWRDETAALKATQRLVTIAHETGARVHVLHVSTAQEMEYLAGHKDLATVETTPHHLTLEAPGCCGPARAPRSAGETSPHRAELGCAARCRCPRYHAPHTREKGGVYLKVIRLTGRRWCPSCRSRQRGQAVAVALRRFYQRRPGASVRDCHEGSHRCRL
jgi:dihydroorotase